MHLRIYDDKTGHMVAETTVPQLQGLILSGSIKPPVVQKVLSSCSAKLETLALRFQPVQYLLYLANQVSESNTTDLELKDCYHKHTFTLSSFWKRCVRVETVKILECDTAFFKHMATSIEAHMSNICIICISLTSNLDNKDLAGLLTVSRVGWKSVKICSPVDLGELSLEALLKHTSTLKSLRLPRCRAVKAIPSIEAHDFIDAEANSDSLKPWPCEVTLRVLDLQISANSHPFNDQVQIYKRLARLVNLESLSLRCLYNDPRTSHTQHDSLEMSLESGLSQLEGLKMMKVLSVGSLMNVGKKEAKWMVDNWPKLHEVRGFDKDNKMHVEAERWFVMDCPHINAVGDEDWEVKV
ncbi:hypothetical protein BGZ65_007964 [Modicella reniformis]|uniref:Uncharacterized protein n=1 Tax=Modicella reniformis TaxID=1440133 RepID=A0A9P6MKU8_9FUNG|nr:hypothetical protein BGZ65_007964 [Modicella reniformis]